LGLARSGIAAARLLASRGADVTATDLKTEAELLAESSHHTTNGSTAQVHHTPSTAADQLDELRRLGAALALGGHPPSLFDQAEMIVLSPGVPADLAPLADARSRGIEVISEPELAGRFLKGRTIGVTGSNGKTTVTTLIGELMHAI